MYPDVVVDIAFFLFGPEKSVSQVRGQEDEQEQSEEPSHFLQNEKSQEKK